MPPHPPDAVQRGANLLTDLITVITQWASTQEDIPDLTPEQAGMAWALAFKQVELDTMSAQMADIVNKMQFGFRDGMVLGRALRAARPNGRGLGPGLDVPDPAATLWTPNVMDDTC